MPTAEVRVTASPDSATAVWDGPVRLVHWLLVALLAASWWTGTHHALDWHRRSGLGVLGLLLFRLYWGFAGSATARFASFVRGPRAVAAYARSLVPARHVATPGHNPMGGWSILLMLAVLTTMVVAGLFAVDIDGLEGGPLVDFVSFDVGRVAATVHRAVFNAVLGVTALHLAAILFYRVRLRHDLVGPMLTGRGSSGPAVTAGIALSVRALVGAVGAAAVTCFIAQGFRL